MKKYDDEATQFQDPEDDATQFEDTISTRANNTTTSSNNVKAKKAKDSTWKHVAVGGGVGLLIGGIAPTLMGMKIPDGTDDHDHDQDSNNGNTDNNEGHEGNEEGGVSSTGWVDDQVPVATTVNDDMSFGEAFAAARAEVGPGGCFEWHGSVYGTYTADEWDNMTEDQRAEWSDHFSWNQFDHSQSEVAQHATSAQNVGNNDEIEIVSVNHNDDDDIALHQQTNDGGDVEVEIIGVVHDNETDVNCGAIVIDGQDAIVIDVDNDLKFDYLVVDANNDNQIDSNEVIDIQDQNLTVNDLGGFSDGPDINIDFSD